MRIRAGSATTAGWGQGRRRWGVVALLDGAAKIHGGLQRHTQPRRERIWRHLGVDGAESDVAYGDVAVADVEGGGIPGGGWGWRWNPLIQKARLENT